MSESYEREPTALENFSGGAGCGCGCLGMLGILLGAVSLIAIPLEMYDGGPGYMLIIGSLTLLIGLIVAAVGGGLFAFSLMVGDVAEPQ